MKKDNIHYNIDNNLIEEQKVIENEVHNIKINMDNVINEVNLLKNNVIILEKNLEILKINYDNYINEFKDIKKTFDEFRDSYKKLTYDIEIMKNNFQTSLKHIEEKVDIIIDNRKQLSNFSDYVFKEIIKWLIPIIMVGIVIVAYEKVLKLN